jgi:pimeloyl-ACP methyl ester carboxylesterase
MPEEHRIPVADGEEVAAVHHEGGGEQWLVFCHGFRSDKSGSYEERCRRAVAEGYDAVRFDFRGCGEADGSFVASTLGSRIPDLRAVLDHFDPATCALFGSSFGAKVTFHVAADDDRVQAIAGRAPLTYNRAFDEAREAVAEQGERRYESGHAIDERFFADLDRYAFPEAAAAIDVPVALFHGRADDSVPLADTLDAVGELDVDVLLRVYAGEDHRFSREGEDRLREELFAWLARAT